MTAVAVAAPGLGVGAKLCSITDVGFVVPSMVVFSTQPALYGLPTSGRIMPIALAFIALGFRGIGLVVYNPNPFSRYIEAPSDAVLSIILASHCEDH